MECMIGTPYISHRTHKIILPNSFFLLHRLLAKALENIDPQVFILSEFLCLLWKIMTYLLKQGVLIHIP